MRTFTIGFTIFVAACGSTSKLDGGDTSSTPEPPVSDPDEGTDTAEDSTDTDGGTTDTAEATDTASPHDSATTTDTASPHDSATTTDTASPHDSAATTDTASPHDSASDSGLVDTAIPLEELDLDGDGFTITGGDCDDMDATVHPAATEVCNSGIDDDCDGLIDDEDPGLSDGHIWFIDYDGDGFGSDRYTLSACEPSEGWVEDDTDCNDDDPSVHPDADEVCNGEDDNCDGDIDDDDPDVADGSVWFIDYDGDGSGSDHFTLIACAATDGWVATDNDCDDENPDIHPDAIEICNSIDDNCDGLVDDEDTDVEEVTVWFIDYDGDGHGTDRFTMSACLPTEGWVATDNDCDDENPDIHPDANEICNTIDDNCNELVDEDDPTIDLSSLSTWYQDTDGDGFVAEGITTDACLRPDGHIADGSESFDCNDDDPSVHPNATEVCNSIDDDCDGLTDDNDTDVDSTSTTTWYRDADGDGYVLAGSATDACSRPEGHTDESSERFDCNDEHPDIHPGAAEVCNSIDDDCDGNTDDEDSDLTDGILLFFDFDGDGYGSDHLSRIACETSDDWIETSDDCDDTRPDINPGEVEVCNSIDDDCDALIDDDDSSLDPDSRSSWYADADGDGYGAPDGLFESCDIPDHHVSDSTDCDDSDPDRNPGATEITDDGQDNNCVNDPPTVGELTLSPDPADTNDTLTIEYLATDPDGDAVTETIVWTVDGVVLDEESETLNGVDWFSRDDEVEATVVASDGTLTSDPASVSTLILNSAPTAPSVGISPESPEAGIDDILCLIEEEGSDADGDALTYTFRWTRDGTPYGGSFSGESSSMISSSDVGADELWVCSATAEDGASSSEATTASVTSVRGQVKDFYEAPGIYEFVVPDDVSTLTVKAWGAGGGATQHGSPGGGGGFGQGTLEVSPGESFMVVVGGSGGGSPACGSGSGGGTPGGGGSGSNYCYHPGYGNGAGGGGYSGIFASSVAHSNALVMGGGGGGGSTPGGAGGGENGQTLATGYGTQGGGGTQSSGGLRGMAGLGAGNHGSALQGAHGVTIDRWGTGGGGGGYYGGGSGGVYCCGHGGGGGGGSGHARGTDTLLIQGDGTDVANAEEEDYRSPAGTGGIETGEDGGPGLVVLIY